jgi:hypothetical protein
MGRHKSKKQVLFYLSHEVHRSLRLQAALTGSSMSEIVERALTQARPGLERARLQLPGQQLPRQRLPRQTEHQELEVIDALAAHDAPIWSSGQPTRLSLEQALAQGLREARQHPFLLRMLPVVLFKNRRRLSWPRLRAAVASELLPALGMLLDLTGAVTGWRTFAAWAATLRAEGVEPAASELFFLGHAASDSYLELARIRTPEVVRRWGFLMATPLDDFQAAVEKFCPDLTSSAATT